MWLEVKSVSDGVAMGVNRQKGREKGGEEVTNGGEGERQWRRAEVLKVGIGIPWGGLQLHFRGSQ